MRSAPRSHGLSSSRLALPRSTCAVEVCVRADADTQLESVAQHVQSLLAYNHAMTRRATTLSASAFAQIPELAPVPPSPDSILNGTSTTEADAVFVRVFRVRCDDGRATVRFFFFFFFYQELSRLPSLQASCKLN